MSVPQLTVQRPSSGTNAPKDAALQDQRISDLCKEIIVSQRREIDQMRALLEEAQRR